MRCFKSRPEESSETARKCPGENNQIHSLSNVSSTLTCVCYVQGQSSVDRTHSMPFWSLACHHVTSFTNPMSDILLICYTSLIKSYVCLFVSFFPAIFQIFYFGFLSLLLFFSSFFPFKNICHEQSSSPLPVFISVLSMVPSSVSYSLFLCQCWLFAWLFFHLSRSLSFCRSFPLTN